MFSHAEILFRCQIGIKSQSSNKSNMHIILFLIITSNYARELQREEHFSPRQRPPQQHRHPTPPASPSHSHHPNFTIIPITLICPSSISRFFVPRHPLWPDLSFSDLTIILAWTTAISPNIDHISPTSPSSTPASSSSFPHCLHHRACATPTSSAVIRPVVPTPLLPRRANTTLCSPAIVCASLSLPSSSRPRILSRFIFSIVRTSHPDLARRRMCFAALHLHLCRFVILDFPTSFSCQHHPDHMCCRLPWSQLARSRPIPTHLPA
jgi:hypothetical protein